MAVYAVRCGKRTGIFDNWLECSKAVLGYSCAEYKKCIDVQEANEYLGFIAEKTITGLTPVIIKENSSRSKSVRVDWKAPSELSDGEAIAYTDGSFDVTSNRFSYGCVLVTSNRRHEFSGSDDNPALVSLRNVAGELVGAMVAVKMAKGYGCKKLTLYHDYTGVSNWVNGQWSARSGVAKAYVDFMHHYMLDLPVEFVWIKGHTNIYGGDVADKLAKEAIRSGKKVDTMQVFESFGNSLQSEVYKTVIDTDLAVSMV